MNAIAMKDSVVKVAGRAGLVLQKYSPEILIGAGTVGFILTIFAASKAALELDKVNVDAKASIELVHEGRIEHDLEEYPDMAYKKDLATVYLKAGVEYGKLYGPTIVLGGLSLAAMLTAHGVMKSRNLALIGAYKLLEEAYARYRSRVVEDYGAEKDYMYYHGLRSEEIVETSVGEDGKKVKTKKTVFTADSLVAGSPYAVFFGPEVRDDDGKLIQTKNPNYTGDPTLDAFFLSSKQSYANNRLCAVGHLFLNEVYESLGLPHTRAGAVVGWVLGDLQTRDHADGVVDFDLYNLLNNTGADFKRHSERGILLDFNVDGVIFDII